MKTPICLNKTWKLALSVVLYFMLFASMAAQTSATKEITRRDIANQPGKITDTTATVTNPDPALTVVEAGSSKESEKRDTSVNVKKDSFTQSQDEWLKNSGYFKANKASATKKSRRNPEPRQSAEVINEKND